MIQYMKTQRKQYESPDMRIVILKDRMRLLDQSERVSLQRGRNQNDVTEAGW